MRKFSIFLLAVIVASGCVGETGMIDEVVLTEKIIADGVSLQADSVFQFKDSVFQWKAWVYDDRYAVCAIQGETYSTALYDLESGARLHEFLYFGNGPKEVIFPSYSLQNDTLVIHDKSRNIIYQVPCCRFPDIEVEEAGKMEALSISTIPYKGGFLALNPYWFKNDRMGIDNKEPMLYLTDGKETRYNSKKTLAINVVQGPLLYSDVKDRVAFVNTSEACVSIFDGNLEKVAEVSGPADYEVQYIQHKTSNELSFYQELATSYVSAASDNDFIYLLYEGAVRDSYDDAVDWDFSSENLYLFVLDWNGTFIESYVLDGIRSLHSVLSVGAEPGIIYVSTLEYGTEDFAIKRFNLNKR